MFTIKVFLPTDLPFVALPDAPYYVEVTNELTKRRKKKERKKMQTLKKVAVEARM